MAIVFNRRHTRTMALLGMIVPVIEKYLEPLAPIIDDDGVSISRIEKAIFGELFDVLYDAGVEIITEDDRRQAGLLPRDENGLTVEELMIMETVLTQRYLDKVLRETVETLDKYPLGRLFP